MLTYEQSAEPVHLDQDERALRATSLQRGRTQASKAVASLRLEQP